MAAFSWFERLISSVKLKGICRKTEILQYKGNNNPRSSLRGKKKSKKYYHKAPTFGVWKQRVIKVFIFWWRWWCLCGQGRFPLRKSQGASFLLDCQKRLHEQSCLLSGMSTEISHVDGPSNTVASAKIWMWKPVLFHLNLSSMFPLVLMWVSPREKAWRWNTWAGMSWCPFHLLSQKCYGAQFFHISYGTLSTGDRDLFHSPHVNGF